MTRILTEKIDTFLKNNYETIWFCFNKLGVFALFYIFLKMGRLQVINVNENTIVLCILCIFFVDTLLIYSYKNFHDKQMCNKSIGLIYITMTYNVGLWFVNVETKILFSILIIMWSFLFVSRFVLKEDTNGKN